MRNEQTPNPTTGADCPCSSLIPLSVFELDYPKPLGGWEPAFAQRGIEIQLDDLGRRAIDRASARDLITERREWAERQAEAARKRTDEVARKKPVLPVGAPAQEGLTAIEALMAAEAATGSYSTPKSEFGPGWGNPTQELMDEQFAEGNRRMAERRDQAAARKKARLEAEAKERLQ